MERLRGVNFGGWFSQLDAIEEKDPTQFVGIDHHMKTFMGVDDFTQVARWGFNHVRLPIDFDLFFDDSLNPIKSRFALLDEAVAAALANRLTIIIDLHKCPGHTFHDPKKNVQQLFVDKDYVKKTAQIWRYLGLRYQGFTNTVFEVLNEPVAPDADKWNEVKSELCAQIRSVAKQTPIVVGSNMWNWPSTYPTLTPVDDPHMIYSVHFYEPLLFTHQQAPWLDEPEFTQTFDYPAEYGDGVVRQFDHRMSAGTWNKDRFIEELAPVVEFQKENGGTIICNEFGCIAQVSSDSRIRWLTDFLEVLKELNIGFTYWNYKNLDFGLFSKGESRYANMPQYQNSQHLDEASLACLINN